MKEPFEVTPKVRLFGVTSHLIFLLQLFQINPCVFIVLHRCAIIIKEYLNKRGFLNEKINDRRS